MNDNYYRNWYDTGTILCIKVQVLDGLFPTDSRGPSLSLLELEFNVVCIIACRAS